MQPFMMQVWDLFLIQMTNWRWSWRSALLTSAIAPLLSMVAFKAFAYDDPLALRYILTGNLVFSLLFGTSDKIATNFAYMRATGMLDFFASMPLSRVALILASAAAFLVMALPTLVVILVVGTLMLDLPLVVNGWVVVVVPLIGFSLCGLGAVIGTVRRPMQEVGSLSSLVNFVLLFLGPVMLPPERISPALRAVGYLSPSTYAASALRNTLFAHGDPIALWVDVLVLAGVMVGFLWWSARRMDWRQI